MNAVYYGAEPLIKKNHQTPIYMDEGRKQSQLVY